MRDFAIAFIEFVKSEAWHRFMTWGDRKYGHNFGLIYAEAATWLDEQYEAQYAAEILGSHNARVR